MDRLDLMIERQFASANQQIPGELGGNIGGVTNLDLTGEEELITSGYYDDGWDESSSSGFENLPDEDDIQLDCIFESKLFEHRGLGEKPNKSDFSSIEKYNKALEKYNKRKKELESSNKKHKTYQKTALDRATSHAKKANEYRKGGDLTDRVKAGYHDFMSGRHLKKSYNQNKRASKYEAKLNNLQKKDRKRLINDNAAKWEQNLGSQKAASKISKKGSNAHKKLGSLGAATGSLAGVGTVGYKAANGAWVAKNYVDAGAALSGSAVGAGIGLAAGAAYKAGKHIYDRHKAGKQFAKSLDVDNLKEEKKQIDEKLKQLRNKKKQLQQKIKSTEKNNKYKKQLTSIEEEIKVIVEKKQKLTVQIKKKSNLNESDIRLECLYESQMNEGLFGNKRDRMAKKAAKAQYKLKKHDANTKYKAAKKAAKADRKAANKVAKAQYKANYKRLKRTNQSCNLDEAVLDKALDLAVKGYLNKRM